MKKEHLRSAANQISITMLEELLAGQMLLPSRLRTINFLSFDKQDHERILLPHGRTVRKRQVRVKAIAAPGACRWQASGQA